MTTPDTKAEETKEPILFNVQTLRLIMGLVALFLPFVVSYLAGMDLGSISASYYTNARDVFVAATCVVGALFLAYNGHTAWQSRLSKVGGVASFLTALFPTSCSDCAPNSTSLLHYGAAAVVFGILTYFCLVAFRHKTKARTDQYLRRRDWTYLICGAVMALCMLTMLGIGLGIFGSLAQAWRMTYFAETIALIAFGISWNVAAKYVPSWFTGPDEALKPSLRTVVSP